MELQEHPDGRTVTVDVRGQVAVETGDGRALCGRVRALVEQGYKVVVLNVADLARVDSVLLGVLVQAYSSAAKAGGALKLQHAARQLQDLLTVTKLDRVIGSIDPQ
jgi:anti-anti-sigma factor